MDKEDTKIKAVRAELNELFNATKKYQSCKAYRELMDFIGQFRTLAPYNAMLVNVQKPGSVYVATAKEWWEKFHRTVKFDATPLVTLFPFGPVRFVFELNDTEGKEFPPELRNPFRITSDPECEDDFKRLINGAAFDGVLCNFADLGSTFAGEIGKTPATLKEQKICLQPYTYTLRVEYEININKNHELSTQLATLAHELGHLYCGHVDPQRIGWKHDKTYLDRNTREFEAESVSYMICKRLGFESPSAEYLNGYLDTNSEIPQDISIDAIIYATNIIASKISGRTPEHKGKGIVISKVRDVKKECR